MAPKSEVSQDRSVFQRHKLVPPASIPKTNKQRLAFPSVKSNTTATPSSPSTHKPHTFPHRLWRSNDPRAQHAWQRAVRVRAETEPGATELERVYAVLCLVVTRNANQHRGQGWWRWVLSLRRALGRLVKSEVDGGVKEQGSGSQAVRHRLTREANLEALKAERVTFIREILLPRCYVAFSSVVRDVQFAAVGVLLMGVLARVGGEVGLPDEARVEVEMVRGVSLRVTGTEEERGVLISREWWGGEEKGEKIERSGIVGQDVQGDRRVEEMGSTNLHNTVASKEEKKKTGKKGKKSTIDDLFAGLL